MSWWGWIVTDRELLELAAKAAGIKAKYSDNYGDFSVGEPYSCDEVRWNPLTDDADALRLAVKLGIEIHPDRQVSEVATAFCIYRGRQLVGLNTVEEFKDDEMAATRRAIVRAAAVIGRAITSSSNG